MRKVRVSKRRRIATAAATALALAATVAGAAGTPYVTVYKVTIYQASSGAGTGALVMFSPAAPSALTGCSYTTGDTVWIDFSASGDPTGRDLYAALLAASVAGKQVTLGVLGCSGSASGAPGYPMVYGIGVAM